MELGAHLPLADLDGRGWSAPGLASYARAAQQLGYSTLAANDHLSFSRPWLDGTVALASVVEASGDLALATTVTLPAVRGPAVVAKTAAALDALSGGRFVLGVGAGSSPDDYALAGLAFEDRWSLFDEAVPALRALLGDGAPPVWVASWGSAAGLRRVARLGDGWLASAYNTTPGQVSEGRAALAEQTGRWLPCVVATMWTWVTDDERDRRAWIARLAAILDRSEQELSGRVLVGPPEDCAGLLSAYAAAGADLVLVWPVADHVRQLERVMQEVVPLVAGHATEP